MTDAQLFEPQPFGRFYLVDKIATGGMAVVYLAIEQGEHGLQRPVVIKQILPQHVEDDSFRRMLFQEARIAARINHPNVVQIYELGERIQVELTSVEVASREILAVPTTLDQRKTERRTKTRGRGRSRRGDRRQRRPRESRDKGPGHGAGRERGGGGVERREGQPAVAPTWRFAPVLRMMAAVTPARPT